MTPVHLTIKSAYLAGPMRGHANYNFPEFHRQAAWLRSEGWTIFSPAERDEADPTIDHEADPAGWADHVDLAYFMSFDLRAVCTHDAVILMKGWETSQGARLEAMVAVEIGHPVFEIVERRIGSWTSYKSRRKLVSVNNARIAAEFIAGTRAYDGLPVLHVADEDYGRVIYE